MDTSHFMRMKERNYTVRGGDHRPVENYRHCSGINYHRVYHGTYLSIIQTDSNIAYNLTFEKRKPITHVNDTDTIRFGILHSTRKKKQKHAAFTNRHRRRRNWINK